MKFRIRAVSQMTGISPNGIRFYEAKNVVMPERESNGKYRSYGPKELSDLLGAKNFRGCGFSLDESVALMNAEGTNEIVARIGRRCDELRKEMEERNLLLDYLRRKVASLESLEADLKGFKTEDRPDLYWLSLEQDGQPRRKAAPREEACRWLEWVPFADSCLLFAAEELRRGEGAPTSLWGLALDSRVAECLHFGPAPCAQRFSTIRCSRTVVEITEDLCMTRESADRVSEFLDHNETAPGEFCVSRRIISVNGDSRSLRFDNLWIPLRV